VWLLVALYYCGQRNQMRLKDAIAAADAINHAVMNYEELSSALVRLEKKGLIIVETVPWGAICTDAASKILYPIAARNSIALRVCQEAEKILGVQPWSPKEPLPHPENNHIYPEFSHEVYEKEVSEYLADMGVKN